MADKLDTKSLLLGVASVAGADTAREVVRLAGERESHLVAELSAVREIQAAGKVLDDLSGRSLAAAIAKAEPAVLLDNLIAATVGPDASGAQAAGRAAAARPAGASAPTAKRRRAPVEHADVPEVLAARVPRNDDFAEKRVHARARNGQVLGAIVEGVERPPHIAQAIDMHRATVLDAIRKLLSEGLVEKLGDRDGFYGPTADGHRAYLELLAEAKLDNPELLKRFGLATPGGDM